MILLFDTKKNKVSGKVGILLLLWIMMLIAIAGALICLRSSPKDKTGVITGILYSFEESSAIINNQVVKEGDIINGIRIIKISQTKVDFEKDDISWAQHTGAKAYHAWFDSNSPSKK